jgi:hypothetical protein
MSAGPITRAKGAQNYLTAMERQRCETCAQSVECYGSTLQCRLGGFLVTKYSVCDRWSMRPKPGFKAPP